MQKIWLFSSIHFCRKYRQNFNFVKFSNWGIQRIIREFSNLLSLFRSIRYTKKNNFWKIWKIELFHSIELNRKYWQNFNSAEFSNLEICNGITLFLRYIYKTAVSGVNDFIVETRIIRNFSSSVISDFFWKWSVIFMNSPILFQIVFYSNIYYIFTFLNHLRYARFLCELFDWSLRFLYWW